MKRTILTLSIFMVIKTIIAQDYSNCQIFQKLIPNDLYGNENLDVWELKQRDTVYFNEEWLNKIKKGNYRIAYRQEYLREPTLKEKYIIKYWSDQAHLNGYMINNEEKLIVDSGKIYRLIPDSTYYDTWFKVTQSQVDKELKASAWLFSMPNISDPQKYSISYYPSRNDVKTEKLDGCVIDKGYSIFNPEKFINQKLLVSWIGQRNNQVQIILRTFDKSAYFVHIFDRSIFYVAYPLLKTEAGKRLSERRKTFNENLTQTIKDVKFTYPDKAFNNFKLNGILFDNNSKTKRAYLIADKFNIETKFLKRDTVLFDDKTEFFQYDCYLKATNDFNTAKRIELEAYLKKNYTEKEIQYIKIQQIFVGMSEKAVLESLGYPFDGINEIVIDNINLRQYVYGLGQYVYVENGKVRGWEKFNFR